MHNADDLREKRMKNMDVKKIIVSFCPYVTPCIKYVRYDYILAKFKIICRDQVKHRPFLNHPC